MCNCGHDAGGWDEAKKLQKKAVVSTMFAACLTGVPGIFRTAGHPHYALWGAVISLQAGLIGRAMLLLRQWRRLSYNA